MLKIPNSQYHQRYYDNLNILFKSLFLEVEDSRLVSFLSPEEEELRVNLLRESDIAPKLYDMVGLFGEEDFLLLVKPAIEELQELNPSDRNYLEVFIECFDKL